MDYNRLERSQTPEAVNVTTSSALVLAANDGRKYVLLTNISDETIYLAFGATAETSKGIVLDPGTAYEINPNNLFVGQINGIHGGAGSKVITLTEE